MKQLLRVSAISILATAAAAQTPTFVKDIITGSGSGAEQNMGELNGRVFFTGHGGGEIGELWVSDGTAAGTKNVKVLYPGPVANQVSYITSLKGKVYFRAATPSTGLELFESDGTAAGTKLVLDILPGPGSGNPVNLTRIRDRIYFAAQSSADNQELWVTDGTAIGTKLVKDIQKPVGSSHPQHITPIGTEGKFLFSATNTAYGREIWISDGTLSGTALLKDIYPGGGAFSSNPQELTAFGKHDRTVVFSARTCCSDYELWTTDGTPAGTKQLTKMFLNRESAKPSYLTRLGDRIYFAAANPWDGTELWVTDGTVPGTKMVRNIVAGSGSSSPRYLTAVGSRHVWFSAWTSATGFELWKSDGTASGTFMVPEIQKGSSGSGPAGTLGDGRLRYATTARGRVYFLADDGTRGRELWFVDNGATSTRKGLGCGKSPRIPTLVAGDPVLGKTMAVSGDDAYPTSVGILLLGELARTPISLGKAAGQSCLSYLDLGKALFVVSAWSVTSSSWTSGLPIPSDTGLIGVRFGMQAVFLPTDAPLGLDMSNGIDATIGT